MGGIRRSGATPIRSYLLWSDKEPPAPPALNYMSEMLSENGYGFAIDDGAAPEGLPDLLDQ
jgi:hypothetical protein